jgi:hypothetical protein
MTIRKGPSGNPRLNPNGSISSGCCCKCYIDLGDCLVETCANAEGAGCCYKCGDTANVTMGDIVASGTGDYAVAAAMLEEASGSTLTLKYNGIGFAASFAYWTKPKPNPDADDGYRWGFGVRLTYISPLGPASAAYWGVYVQLYRVPEAAFVQGGPCEDVETRDVMQPKLGYGDPESIYPEFAAKSTCCGGSDIPVEVNTGVEELTSCTYAPTVAISSTCDSVCACGALNDEVTVETGDISRLLTRVGDCDGAADPDCDCWWKMEDPPAGTCPAKTYNMEIQRRGCDWRLDITEGTWEDVIEEGVPVCRLVDSQTGFWFKYGGTDVLGTYTRTMGTIGDETAVIE